MNEVYRDKIATYYFITVLMSLTALIILGILLSQFTSRQIPLTIPIQLFLIVLFLLNIVVLISFRELTVLITDDKIFFGYGKFQKKFQRSDIEAVELSEYKFSNYLGYGIRFGRDGTIGYVPRGGQGLKIKFKIEKRAYFFITNRADELKNILQKNV